jgi:hypothetical protein
MFVSWFALAGRAAVLGLEAQTVIALRLMRLAAGGNSSRTEAMHMVTDKIAALAEVQIIGATAFVTGQSAQIVVSKTLRNYKKRIGANRRRLTRR